MKQIQPINESIEAKATRALLCHDELVSTLIGVSKSLQRMIEKYNPDDIESEWIGEANEALINATGKPLGNS